MSVHDRACSYCGEATTPGVAHNCPSPGARWRRDARDGVYTVIAKQDAVRDLVVAVDRLVDNWAEADEAVRKQLWQAMAFANHVCSELHYVYPLAGAVTGERAQP